MNGRTALRFGFLAAIAVAASPASLPAQSDHDHHAQVEANASMAHHNHLNNPHMKWTAERAQSADGQKRAEEVVTTLRPALEKYKDYRVALADGYKIFAPNVAQPEYHFTNYWNGLRNAFSFDPARPTSLLYRKTADGYELVGAMYTASRIADEDDLNQRIPLSVARWHQHVNICLPARGAKRTADWTRFGPRGSIVTEAQCKEAGGRWRAHLFGWMVHVYPFESESARIWTHH
ncbi:MAG TPA: hypothetical protein VLB32_01160 [Candidatus Acidoferrales bacterium]|nr:hypothetical protein [Candidatus Acidoferrales bacterium]